MNHALFYPPDRERGPSRAARTAQAKQVCGRCPVLAACRALALGTREPFGIWGGLTEDERQTLLAPHPDPGPPGCIPEVPESGTGPDHRQQRS